MRKSFNNTWLLFILLLLNFSHLSAQNGGQAGEFLRYGVGARALGMGRAFVAVADDATAIYWNPAGISRIDQWEIVSMYTDLYGKSLLSTGYGYLAYVRRTSYGNFGVGLVNLHVGFERRDEFNQVLGHASNDETGLLISYGKELSQRIEGGLGIKLLHQGICGTSNWGQAFDIGIIMRLLAKPKLDIAGVIQNIGGSLENDNIPLSGKLGVSFNIVNMDLQFMQGQLRQAIGLEIDRRTNFGDFALRAGFNNTEYSFGFGLAKVFGQHELQIDAAYAFHKKAADLLESGNSFRISFTLRKYKGPSRYYRPTEYANPCVYKLKRGCSAEDKESNRKLIELYKNSTNYRKDLIWVAKAYVALAECGYIRGNWDGAISNYGEAERIINANDSKGAKRRDAFDYVNNLHFMECHMHKANWNMAIDIYTNKMESNEKSKLEILYDVGVCYTEFGNFDSAIAMFEQISNLTDTEFDRIGLAYLKLGEIFSDVRNSNKDYNRAIEYLKVVTQKYQTNLECYPSFPEYFDDNIADDAQYLIGRCSILTAEDSTSYMQALAEFAKVPRYYPDLTMGEIIDKCLDNMIVKCQNKRWGDFKDMSDKLHQIYKRYAEKGKMLRDEEFRKLCGR
jgi:tetratricopeptide (TPR) repeat protein